MLCLFEVATLFAFLAFLPQYSAQSCPHNNEQSITAIGSLYLSKTTLMVNWNISEQSFDYADFYYTCEELPPESIIVPNKIKNTERNNRVGNWQLSTPKITLNTTCVVCIYYKTESSEPYKMMGPFSFSFKSHCVNKTYEISSNVPLIISRHSKACFTCLLPSGITPSIWNYNDITMNVALLAVSDTSVYFSDSDVNPILKCSNVEKNQTLQAHVKFQDPAPTLSTSAYNPPGTVIQLSSTMVAHVTSNSHISTTETQSLQVPTTVAPNSNTTSITEAQAISHYVIAATISSSLLILILFGIFAILWVYKRTILKNEIKYINAVVEEHTKCTFPLQHIPSVCSELDQLEWVCPSSPCRSVAVAFLSANVQLCSENISTAKCVDSASAQEMHSENEHKIIGRDVSTNVSQQYNQSGYITAVNTQHTYLLASALHDHEKNGTLDKIHADSSHTSTNCAKICNPVEHTNEMKHTQQCNSVALTSGSLQHNDSTSTNGSQQCNPVEYITNGFQQNNQVEYITNGFQQYNPVESITTEKGQCISSFATLSFHDYISNSTVQAIHTNNRSHHVPNPDEKCSSSVENTSEQKTIKDDTLTSCPQKFEYIGAAAREHTCSNALDDIHITSSFEDCFHFDNDC